MPNVIAFARPAARFIEKMLAEYPAFGPLAARVRIADDPESLQTEQLFSQLLQRALWVPRMTTEEAELVLDHDASRDEITAEELDLLAADEKSRSLHELWAEVWMLAESDNVRNRIRYAAALLARLYRLEPQVMREAAAQNR